MTLGSLTSYDCGKDLPSWGLNSTANSLSAIEYNTSSRSGASKRVSLIRSAFSTKMR